MMNVSKKGPLIVNLTTKRATKNAPSALSSSRKGTKSLRRRGIKTPLPARRAVGVLLVVVIIVNVCLLCRSRTRRLNDGPQQQQQQQRLGGVPIQTPTRAMGKPESDKKFLLLNKKHFSEGAGNIMLGLLAAHLLGREFDRVVCVTPDYAEFHAAFESVHPPAIEHCPKLPPDVEHETIFMEDYMTPPDECKLKALLESDRQVLLVNANTYPRWPDVPENFFFEFYRARPELLAMLNYGDAAPDTVVHLRAGDGYNDPRWGTDEESFAFLGKKLPSNTYLVTNKVEWYDKFEREYGWSHPDWNEVVHSSHKTESWGKRHEDPEDERFVREYVPARLAKVAGYLSPSEQQGMQLFADWYTLLNAKTVYHTHSEFSTSAVHWMGIVDSHIIYGWNEYKNELMFEMEKWRLDGTVIPLVDRTVEARGTDRLWHCSNHEYSDGTDDQVEESV